MGAGRWEDPSELRVVWATEDAAYGIWELRQHPGGVKHVVKVLIVTRPVMGFVET